MNPPDLHFMPSLVEEILTGLVERAIADRPDLQELVRHSTYRVDAVGKTFIISAGGVELLRIPARKLEAEVRKAR